MDITDMSNRAISDLRVRIGLTYIAQILTGIAVAGGVFGIIMATIGESFALVILTTILTFASLMLWETMGHARAHHRAAIIAWQQLRDN